MAQISFEEEQYGQQFKQSEDKPLLVRLVLKTGIVSTDQDAKYVLLGISVTAILLAFIIPSFFGSYSKDIPAAPVVWPPPQQQQ